MGSDLHMNPPPPPPLHIQVKALVDRNAEMAETLRVQKAQIIELQRENEALERTVARQAVQLQGHPFAAEEEDHMDPTHPDYDDGTAAVLAGEDKPWCTCGAKTPQPQGHRFDCPARKGT